MITIRSLFGSSPAAAEATKKRKADELRGDPALPDPAKIDHTDSLPDELILSIFADLAARKSEKSQKPFVYFNPLPRVCKRWNGIARDSIIFQLFVLNRYPHLNAEHVPRQYYEQAFNFAVESSRLSNMLSGKTKNIFGYLDYAKRLSTLLKITEETKGFFNSLPYFDLRPLAWYKEDQWMLQFSQICPHLKNVRVLDASEIGSKIGYHRIPYPEVPVLKRVTKITKEAVKLTGELWGMDTVESKKKDLTPFVLFCIHAIGKASGKLTTLYCSNSGLKQDDLRNLLTQCPTLTDIYTDQDWNLSRNLDALGREFPKVAFHNKWGQP